MGTGLSQVKGNYLVKQTVWLRTLMDSNNKYAVIVYNAIVSF